MFRPHSVVLTCINIGSSECRHDDLAVQPEEMKEVATYLQSIQGTSPDVAELCDQLPLAQHRGQTHPGGTSTAAPWMRPARKSARASLAASNA